MNQLLLAPPQPQARLPLPKPTYCVWAMDGKGNSHLACDDIIALSDAQWVARAELKARPNAFVYIVGWCGHKCIGHWHNLFGPDTNDSRWKQGDIRDQVRAFIRPERRTRTRQRPYGGTYQ